MSGETKCEELKIQYRGSVAEKAIVLITKDDKVIIQFQVAEELLSRKNINFESWMDTDKIRRQQTRQASAYAGSKESSRIQDLRHGMKKVIVEAEVLTMDKPRSLQTQYGNNVVLTSASIADQTGKIRLCLWNGQADLIKIGDTLRIEGASVATFRGERNLRLGRTGTITKMQTSVLLLNPEHIKNPKNILYA
jgi:replication factor A1